MDGTWYRQKNWEQDIADYIVSRGFQVEKNFRHFYKKKEIDIYIPSLKIGFELNGAWFHNSYKSLANKPIDYHQEKTLLAARKGIRLVHLWSTSSQESNISIIDRTLGIADLIDNGVTFKKVSMKNAKNFFKTYSTIRGFLGVEKSYGVYAGEDLLCTADVRRLSKTEVEIVYFVQEHFIQVSPEIIRRLVKYTKKCLRVQSVVLTVSRNIYPVFENSIWDKVGFEQERIIDPRMFYYNSLSEQAYNRISFTKDRLKERWKDFRKSLNEEENCAIHHFYRCYDSGAIKIRMAL